MASNNPVTNYSNGFTQPGVMTVDPTPPALKTLQALIAQMFQQRLTSGAGGGGGMPVIPGMDIFQQLYGNQPTIPLPPTPAGGLRPAPPYDVGGSPLFPGMPAPNAGPFDPANTGIRPPEIIADPITAFGDVVSGSRMLRSNQPTYMNTPSPSVGGASPVSASIPNITWGPNGPFGSTGGSLFPGGLNPFDPHGGRDFGSTPLPPGIGQVGNPGTGGNGTTPDTGGGPGAVPPGGNASPPTTVPGSGPSTTPNVFDPSTFNFGAFDLPIWGGPYSAPLVNQQLDALKGFSNLANQNPVAQTFNQMNKTGATVADMGAAFGPTSNFSAGPNGGPAGVFDRISGQNATGIDLTGMQGILDRAMGLTNVRSDVSGVINPLQAISNNPLDPSNRGLSTNYFNSIFGNTTPGAGAYNTTPMYGAARDVFNTNNAREQARLREELSNLGLDPGSTDRLDVLGRASSEGLANFELGMQDLARQSFESSENRRAGLVPSLMQNEGMPFQEQLATRNQTLAAAPTLLNALTTGTAEAQMAAQIQNQLANTTLSGAATSEQARQAQQQQVMQAAAQRAGLTQANTAEQQFGIQQALAALGQQGGMMQGLFNMGETARGVADTDIARRILEFQRSQGGGLDQITNFMNSQPGLNTGITPSPLSQGAAALPGAASIIQTLWDVYKNFK